jgi:hypothetical protein
MKISKAYRPELLVAKGKEANALLTDPYLDVKEKRLVATEGHALIALPVDVEKGERSRYLACSLLAAARGLGEADVPAEIKDQEIVEYGVLWPTAQERTFPDWKSLIPPFKQGDAGTTTIHLNARLLKNLADAMGSAGGVALTFPTGNPVAPVLVRSLLPEAAELGLLMPLRQGAEDEVDPDQRCPVCKRLLAAGAACPEHGLPSRADLDRKVEKAKRTMDEVREIVGAPSRTVPALDWVPCYGGIEADLPDGSSFRIGEMAKGGYELVRVKPNKKGLTSLGRDFDTESDAKKRAAQILTEDVADAWLQNAGAGELTRKDTKGPAVARKKGGRRA